MSRIAILTDTAVGGTFISWSIQWLSGQESYFNAKADCYQPLLSNPLTEINSHKFIANQALTLTEAKNFLNTIPNNTSTQHFYFHILRAAGKYSEENNKAETNVGIDLVVNSCDKVIVIKQHKDYQLYHCSLNQRSIGQNFDGTRQLENNRDALDDFIEFFFKENFSKWKSQGLTNVWDKREFIALSFNPFYSPKLSDCHAFGFDYLDLPAHVCWLNLDTHIKNIFDYCNIQLDNSKFNHWLNVYNHWKTLHQDRIKFCKSFDTIVNNILAGQDMDLSEFNLDIVREAAIQHALIYWHNLNLKTWQLEKFVNTKQLHSLLEPNIH